MKTLAFLSYEIRSEEDLRGSEPCLAYLNLTTIRQHVQTPLVLKGLLFLRILCQIAHFLEK